MEEKFKILSNQIRCLKCGDEPFSRHRHHCATCKCGAVSCDGGMEYLRRVGLEYIDLSIVVDELVYETCLSALDWADETGRNNLGRLCAIFIALRNIGFLDGNGNE